MSAHRFVNTVPGQGAGKVCATCGARQTTASDDGQHPHSECSGTDRDLASQVISDYEPIE